MTEDEQRSTLATRLARASTTGAGRAVAGVIAVIDVRPAAKPMHPRGEVLVATLRRHGGAATGAAFLDEAGEDEVLVRFSRSVGLPAGWPDVNGLAIRVPTPDGPQPHADVLFAGTGQGAVSRWLFKPSRLHRGPFLGTLLPYRTPTGPVLLGARPTSETTWELSWARPRSSWTPFAEIGLADEPGRDLDLSFDAVGAAPSGLEVYDWQRRVRGPSYAVSRRLRGTVSPHELEPEAQSSTTMSSPRRST
ncbi:MAG: putative phosphodiesterase [Nocardioides sp.]|nr:putative phosphodiesterase [Nocardioides sp.]